MFKRLFAFVALGPVVMAVVAVATIVGGLAPRIEALVAAGQSDLPSQILNATLSWLVLPFIAGVIVVFLSARHLTTGLNEISKALRHAREGEFRARVGVSGEPILRRLRLDVNKMLRAVGTRVSDLEGARQTMRAVLEGMTEGVLVTDEQGRILMANRSGRQILSINGPVEGKALLEVSRTPELARAFARAVHESAPISAELVLQVPETRYVMVRWARWEAPDGNGGLVCMLHDISEIRRLEQVRRDFVSNASHELRTPVAAIRGYAEALQDGEPLPDEARTCVNVIERHARRLGALVNDILLLARLEEPSYVIEMGPVDLVQAAENVVRALARVARERRVIIRTRFDEGLPVALADREAVEHVLLNLLDNAMKYGSEGGIVTLRGQRSDDFVVLEVADEGPGVAEAEVPRIFERFYRGEDARARGTEGTGLGLSIVRHLVQVMHGTVSIHSTPGKGATFRVRLKQDRGPGGDESSRVRSSEASVAARNDSSNR